MIFVFYNKKVEIFSTILLIKAGYKDISVITYENMRHEILNEKDKEKVMKDILEFFEK